MTDRLPLSVNLDALMQAHLAHVFNERDGRRRLEALKELYTNDSTLFEPHAAVTGYAAISGAVDALQASLPPEFVFTGRWYCRRPQWTCPPALARRSPEWPRCRDRNGCGASRERAHQGSVRLRRPRAK
jgi:hypothetical protein